MFGYTMKKKYESEFLLFKKKLMIKNLQNHIKKI